MSQNATKSNRTGCWIGLILLAGFLLIMGWLGWKGWRTYTAVRSLQARQAQVEELASAGLEGVDLQALDELVTGLRRDVAIIKAETALFMPLTAYLGWVPQYGPLLVDAPQWLEMADAGTLALVDLFAASRPVIEQMQSAENRDLRQLIAALDTVQPALEQSKPYIERIETAYRDIDSWQTLPDGLDALQEPIDSLLPLAPNAVDLLGIMPELMGMDGPRTYLLLAQNEDELRATGGLISGIGLLRVEDGAIQSLEFIDSYDVDDLRNKPYDAPPQPYEQFMGIRLLLMRDANFWPDFPYSAEKAADLFRYGQDGTPPIDGVIAIDQEFLRVLLGVTGPVAVAELDMTVDANNIVEQLRAAYNTDGDEEVSGEWWQQRKSFMAPVATAIQDKIFDDPGALNMRQLLFDVFDSGRGKHLQLYLTDPQAAAVVARMGLDGSLPDPDGGDIVLVQDMNMGYNKVNAIVDRRLHYAVDLTTDVPTAQIDATYMHNGTGNRADCEHFTAYDTDNQYQGFFDNCYWNYVRVYAPTGSQLLEASSYPAPADWFVTGEAWDGVAGTIEDPSGLTVFDNFLVVEQQQSADTFFRYQLPASVVQTLPDGSKQYRLIVVKPAGTRVEPVQVQIELPQGATVIDTDSADATIDGNTVVFDFLLSKDTPLSVRYR